MDADLKALSAVYAFVLIGSGSALYVEPHKRVGYIPLLTECDGPGSNLTATLGPVNAARVSQFNTRREINEMMWTAVAAAGGTVIMGTIADLIKSKANSDSCSMTIGTDSDGHHVEGYAYQATTSGHDCKTTAERKAILAAVKKMRRHSTR
ncbi:hypothetical protein HG531_004732 [Fusarium graminearum]|nr:hypothetical protein HG531_004732 [Fusarium graminearum]